jgi:hypothetical protein
MSDFKQYLPSKRFQIVVLVIAAAAVLFILATFLFSKKSEYKKADEVETESVLLGSVIYQDTDNDGLWDWEEALWGTDPKNPDTDGDGIRDFDEVEALRPEAGEPGESEYTPETETGTLSRELVSAILSLKQNGSLNQENLASIAQEIGKGIENKGLFSAYSLDSVSTVAESQATHSSYKTRVQSVFSQYTNSSIGEELNLLPLYFENPADHQSELEIIIEDYKNLARALLLTDIPRPIAVLHVSLMNNANRVALALEELLFLEDDPLRGVAGISYYEEYSDAFISNLETITNYLSLEQ